MPPYSPPTNVSYTEVTIPVYVNPMKLMKYLYYITEKTWCTYMWVDLLRNVVEIWGPENTLRRAIAMTRRRIATLATKNIFVPHEYDELPEQIRLRLKVIAWKMNKMVYYRISGHDSDIRTFVDCLFFDYPFNPYCTNVKSVKPNESILSRLNIM